MLSEESGFKVIFEDSEGGPSPGSNSGDIVCFTVSELQCG